MERGLCSFGYNFGFEGWKGEWWLKGVKEMGGGSVVSMNWLLSVNQWVGNIKSDDHVGLKVWC